MPKHTKETLNPGMLELLATELEQNAATLRHSAAIMKIGPPIESLECALANNRQVGMRYLQTWVSEVRQTVMNERIKASRTVSESRPQELKNKPKKPINHDDNGHAKTS